MSVSVDQLLAWAAQGWYVFPLAPGSKLPMAGTHGVSDATTNPDQIRAWCEAAPSCNYGVNCGLSGLLVLDVDKYKPGAKEALNALDWDYGIPPTLTVTTPRGGTHQYYKGTASSSVCKLGPGIDTRGRGGYVVLPGSTTPDGEYVISNATHIADTPEWMIKRAGKVADHTEEKLDKAPACTLDTAATILAASDYLKTQAPPAIEGEGGDMKTLHAAMMCKDLGVSQDTALELMIRDYNPRCVPEWDFGDLERKVANAFRYGKNTPGAASLEAVGFTPVPQVLSAAPAHPASPLAQRADTFDADRLPPRPWILGYDLMAGFLTATVAQGGVGKSMIAMVESMSVATGKALAGVEVKRQGPAWIYNTEDPMDELQRRILAAAQHYELTRADLHDVHVSSGRSNPLILAKSERGVVHVNQVMIDTVCAYIAEHKIVTWCVDPFVHTHYCEENSNSEMAVVLQAFGRIAELTGAAINLVHHTSKGSTGTGDMDKARGASAFGGAVRIMRHAQTMSEDDCKSWGVDPHQRKKYIGLYDAKGNMSPPADRIRWFEKVSIILPNGDNVGTVKVCGLTKVTSKDLSPVIDRVLANIESGKYEAGDPVTADVVEAFEGANVYVPGTGKRVTIVYKDEKPRLFIEENAIDFIG